MSDAARVRMVTQRAALFGLTLLACAACGPPPGMPPSPTNPPVKPPPPQTSEWDGTVIGADHVAPADELASGPQVVVRPGDEQPVRAVPAPGWYVDENGVPHYSRDERERMIGSTKANAASPRVEKGTRAFRPGQPAPAPAPKPSR
jgi:hypothetical protein